MEIDNSHETALIAVVAYQKFLYLRAEGFTEDEAYAVIEKDLP